jgi:hypothetical protein
MSQDEDEDSGKAFFFSSAAPAVATTVTVAAPQARPEAGSGPEPAPGFTAAPPAMPFDRNAAAQPRDDAEEFSSRTWSASELEAPDAPSVTPLFSQNQLEAERDLDVPAFMRRLQF